MEDHYAEDRDSDNDDDEDDNEVEELKAEYEEGLFNVNETHLEKIRRTFFLEKEVIYIYLLIN